MTTFLSKISTLLRGDATAEAETSAADWMTNAPFADIRITAEPPNAGWWRWQLELSFQDSETNPVSERRETRHELRCSNVFDPVPDLVRFIEAIFAERDAAWLIDEEGRACDMSVWSISPDVVLFHINSCLGSDSVRLQRQTLLRELAKAYLALVEDDNFADWCRDLPHDADYCTARAYYKIPYHSARMQRLLAFLFPVRQIDPIPLLGFIRPGTPSPSPPAMAESHDKALQALFGSRLPAVMGQARRVLLSGETPNILEDTEGETRLTVRVWPEHTLTGTDEDFEVAGIAFAGVFAPDKDETALPALFPLLEGMPNLNDSWDNTLLAADRFPWANTIEGEVLVKGPFQTPLRLYECLHFREAFCEWACACDVAAVAYSCAKARDTIIHVQGLHDDESEKKAYCIEHPGDHPPFPGIRVRTSGSRRLEATETFCEYAYRTTVDQVEKLHFRGVTIYRIHALLAGWPGECGVYAYLYASEAILQDYIPQVGDPIEGVCRLQCRFTQRRPKIGKGGYVRPPFPERDKEKQGPSL